LNLLLLFRSDTVHQFAALDTSDVSPWPWPVLKDRTKVLGLGFGLEALVLVIVLDFGKDKENPILRLRLSNKISKQVVFQRKGFSLLKGLFSRILCIPATSAPVERIFSQSGLIMRPHRARMTDSLLETLMFIKCNSDI
jgi:hypothetical protein